MANKFWDELNTIFENVFSKRVGTSSDGLVNESDLRADINDTFSPEAQKEILDRGGYAEPARKNPYEQNAEEMHAVISEQPSPYTVIDVDGSSGDGRRVGVLVAGNQQGGVGEAQMTKAFPPNTNTVDRIAQALNAPQLKQSTIAGIGSNLISLLRGETYEINLSGNSVKVERLPIGIINGLNSNYDGNSHNTDGRKTTIKTIYGPNDSFIQNLYGVLFNGLFIQFQTSDSAIVIAKPGETYNALFSKIYITTFGGCGKYRITVGNKANIVGSNEDKPLRQKLSMWDGLGLFDSLNFHPVPISLQFGYFIDGTHASPNYAILMGNTDDGSGLVSYQNPINVVDAKGYVNNPGYIVFWITAMTYMLKSNAAGTALETSIEIRKVNYSNGYTYPPLWYDYSAFTLNAVNRQTVQFAEPIRVVLAGFDAISPNQINSGNLKSGEQLTIAGNNFGGVGQTYNIFLQGYGFASLNNRVTTLVDSNQGSSVMPSFNQLSKNPYPSDVMLPGI